jgi:hypothetical protein
LWQPDVVTDWISHFENVLPDALSQAVSLLPAQWYKGDINSLRGKLLHRLADLTNLIEADRVGSNQGRSANGTLRVSHPGTHGFGVAV